MKKMITFILSLMIVSTCCFAQNANIDIEGIGGARLMVATDELSDTTSLNLNSGELGNAWTFFELQNQNDQLSINTSSDLLDAGPSKFIMAYNGCVQFEKLSTDGTNPTAVYVDPFSGYLVTAPKVSSIASNIYGAYLTGNSSFEAGFAFNSGIEMPNAGISTASWNFTVPADYAPGTTIDVTLYVSSPSTANAILNDNFLSVGRENNFLTGGPVSAGLEIITDPINFVNSNEPVAVNITIDSPDSAEMLMPGDFISFGIFRSTDDNADVIRINGMSIDYTPALSKDCTGGGGKAIRASASSN